MCDQERPCGRCVGRNIQDLCRDAEEDIHSVYKRYRQEAQVFHNEVRVRRAALGLPSPAPPTAPDYDSMAASGLLYQSDVGGGTTKSRWLAYLDDTDVCPELQNQVRKKNGWGIVWLPWRVRVGYFRHARSRSGSFVRDSQAENGHAFQPGHIDPHMLSYRQLFALPRSPAPSLYPYGR